MADLYPTIRPRSIPSERMRPEVPALFIGGGRAPVKATLDFDALPMTTLGWGLDVDGNPVGLGARDGKRMDPQVAWSRQGWFRKCADVRAKAVSSLPWAIYPEGTEPGDYERAIYTSEDVAPPPELEALRDFDLSLYLTEAALSLVGKAYHLIDRPDQRNRGRLGRMAALQWVHPLLMREKYGRGGVTQFLRTVNGVDTPYDPEAVVAVYQPDPFREIGPGSSDGMAASVNAAALDSLARFVSRYLDGGLIKQTVLTVDQEYVDPEQKAQLESWWRKFITRGNAGDAKVLSGKVHPHVIGDGLGDLSDEKLTNEQREATAAAFGIPFSVMMANAANYATAEVEERGFLMRTVVPQARIAERSFNRQLLMAYGLALRFEPERTEIMQRFELEKAEKVHAVVGAPVLTIDEGRRLLGYEPMEPDQMPQPAAPPNQAPATNGQVQAGGDGQAGDAKALDVAAVLAAIVGEGY